MADKSRFPIEMVQACAWLGVDPRVVLAYKIYPEKVVLVTPDGRKQSVPLPIPKVDGLDSETLQQPDDDDRAGGPLHG